jgi:hypothetical protein
MREPRALAHLPHSCDSVPPWPRRKTELSEGSRARGKGSRQLALHGESVVAAYPAVGIVLWQEGTATVHAATAGIILHSSITCALSNDRMVSTIIHPGVVRS